MLLLNGSDNLEFCACPKYVPFLPQQQLKVPEKKKVMPSFSVAHVSIKLAYRTMRDDTRHHIRALSLSLSLSRARALSRSRSLSLALALSRSLALSLQVDGHFGV